MGPRFIINNNLQELHFNYFYFQLLFFSESIRDAADLYLSFKFPPVVTVVDTPCTMSTHLAFREPEKCDIWFQDRQGCFQKPKKDVLPDKVSVPFLKNLDKVNDKDQEQRSREEHPRSGSSSRFILGDRFHASTNPHKDKRWQFLNFTYKTKSCDKSS